MGKGKFINQKLGKNVSRRFDLLRSELAGHAAYRSSPGVQAPRLPKKGISREGK